MNELNSSIIAFAYDANAGRLEELQNVSLLLKDFAGNSSAAEVAVAKNGRFLYGSNRGFDSIAVFAIDVRNGMLTPLQQVPTQGKNPRHFGIDPTGAYLFVENQDSDNIVVFRIDQNTGKLSPTGKVLEVSMPVCLVFLAEK